MSYIFEALKKLEQKRERERVSRLLMVTGEAAPERKQWPFWPFSVLAALLLLNAGVLLWWVRPRVPEKQPAPAKPPATTEARSEHAATAPREEPRPVDKPALQLNAAGRSLTPAAEHPSRTGQAPQAKPADVPPNLRPVNRGAVAVLDLKELPAAVKDSLPALTMSAHYYTPDPQARFTRINDLNLREGQTLTSGVKLEAITPDGAVLSYQGYRFRMGISETR